MPSLNVPFGVTRNTIPMLIYSDCRKPPPYDGAWYGRSDITNNEPHRFYFPISGIHLVTAQNLTSYLPEDTQIDSVEFNFYVRPESASDLDGYPNKHLNKSWNFTFEARHEDGSVLVSDTLAHTLIVGWNKITLYGDKSLAPAIRKNVKVSSPGFYWIENIGPQQGRQCYTESEIKTALMWIDDSSNKAYYKINYSYIPSKPPKSLTPENSTINPRSIIRFAWDVESTQKGFQLRWNVDGGTWTTITETTSNRFYEMESNTITTQTGDVRWEVRVLNQYDLWSPWSGTNFSLGTPLQEAPRVISPIGDYIDSKSLLRFEWSFVSNSTETQNSYEIEYSLRPDMPVVRITGLTEQFRDVDINGSKTAVGRWRIRVTNNFNETSPWTDFNTFLVIGAPPRPQILSVSNGNLPLITWHAEDQETFNIKIIQEDILIFDSGKIIGSDTREYRVPKELINGKYTAMLIVNDAYGGESSPSEYTFTIDVVPITTPVLSVENREFFTAIYSNPKDAEVWRNGKLIGETVNGLFLDYTGANDKEYDYQLRLVENQEIVSKSELVKGRAYFNVNTLALLSDPSKFVKLKWNIKDRPQRDKSTVVDKDEIKLDGRPYSVWEFGTRKTSKIAFKFFILIKDNTYDDFMRIVESSEEVIYRDYFGEIWIGVIEDVEAQLDIFGHRTGFRINRTRDVNE